MLTPNVSVVLPSFNEAARLPRFIEDLVAHGLKSPRPTLEFIIVDDGSKPNDLQVVRQAVTYWQKCFHCYNSPHRIKLIVLEGNRGKGAAIRRGWSNACSRSQWLGFVDADGAISACEFFRLVKKTEGADFDVLAGSRVKLAGRSVERHLFRQLQGRMFAGLAKLVLNVGFYDSQCGFKLFRASMLRPLLADLKENRWLIDLEILALMKKNGARLFEEPIDWMECENSKMRLGIDAAKMFSGLHRLRRRHYVSSPSPRGKGNSLRTTEESSK